MSLPRLDRAAQNSAWFGALSSSGTVVDVYPIERARLPAWIGERLGRQAQRASREVLEFLADRVEGNLLAAHQEVQKLALLAPPGELEFDTVRESVADVARYDAFSASEALLAGDTARYARAIAGLQAEGEAATLVLWALTEDLRALARFAHRALEEALIGAAAIDRAADHGAEESGDQQRGREGAEHHGAGYAEVRGHGIGEDRRQVIARGPGEGLR